MRGIGLLTAAFFVTGLYLATGAAGEQMHHQSAGVQQSDQLQISTGEEIQQFSLKDQQGQELGQIDQVLVDQDGKIGYVVTSDDLQQHVIPWNALQVDAQQQALTVQMSADQLQQAPAGDAQVVFDQSQAQQINEFYGAAPAWGAQPQPQQIKGLQELQQFSLVDQRGQQLGRVNQVLVDVQRGQIGYVLVTSQQGQQHLIPWNALQPDLQQQRLTLQMDAQRFQQAPTGDARVVRDMNRARQIHQFYGVTPYFETTGMQQPVTRTQPGFQQQQTSQPGQQQLAVRSVDTLKQFSLRDQQGQQLGQVNQLLVDVQQGKIGYVVATSQQQQQQQQYLIPWNALQIDPQQQTMTLQISAAQFQQAPTGDEQMVQDMNQARQIHQFYGVSPYWEEGMQQGQQPMHPQMHQQMQQQPQRQFPAERQ